MLCVFFFILLSCVNYAETCRLCVWRAEWFLRVCAVQNRRRRTLDSGFSLYCEWCVTFSRLNYTTVTSFLQACIAGRVADDLVGSSFFVLFSECPAAGPGESCILGAPPLSLSLCSSYSTWRRLTEMSAASRNRRNLGVPPGLMMSVRAYGGY